MIELTYRTETDEKGEYIAIDAVVPPWRRKFKGVAFIFDLGSGNPIISVPNPMGCNAIEQIIKYAKKEGE